ncbi:hypothetical protein GCM10010185_36860 [Saccharothrix coeruleofusca]|uniref:Uncharacterized protein n=1 Tax=Saccharothrix coeruleofusca TaxID=33919 RepID=A0A918ANE2_9PSEU|nr:hypothetical protein GCM10010185_36860 [Saccharothrix coeruleofusca]
MISVTVTSQPSRKVRIQKRRLVRYLVMVGCPVGSGWAGGYSQRFRRNIRYSVRQATRITAITMG